MTGRTFHAVLSRLSAASAMHDGYLLLGQWPSVVNFFSRCIVGNNVENCCIFFGLQDFAEPQCRSATHDISPFKVNKATFRLKPPTHACESFSSLPDLFGTCIIQPPEVPSLQGVYLTLCSCLLSHKRDFTYRMFAYALVLLQELWTHLRWVKLEPRAPTEVYNVISAVHSFHIAKWTVTADMWDVPADFWALQPVIYCSPFQLSGRWHQRGWRLQ